MPRGSSPKREREYKEILGNMKKRGEYKGREEEVAARVVNKQRREAGETKGKSKSGGSRSGSSRTRTSRSTTKPRSTRSGAQGRSTRSSSSRTRSSSKRK